MQERETTTRKIKVLEHNDSQHFIVNVHALHNANIIHKIFPESMYSQPSVLSNRLGLHKALARSLGDGVHDDMDVDMEQDNVQVMAQSAGMDGDPWEAENEEMNQAAMSMDITQNLFGP